MVNPVKTLTMQFLVRTPMTLLTTGVALSVLDFAVLVSAATRERVLHLSQGVGLLQNYGLFSTIIGNGVFFYLARVYLESVYSIKNSKALTDGASVDTQLSVLTDMMKMKGQYRFLIYLFIAIGSVFWMSNVAFHVVGNPEIRWGHKVFDSPDHRLTFYASRLHNLYTWLLVLPFLGHVMIYVSIQLRRAVGAAVKKSALRYDLLNPDQQGGFLFIEKAHVIFNVVIALIYVQITLHIETFEKMHVEHVIAYIFVTLLLIGVNRIFFGDLRSTINTLKLERLNELKEKVYNEDQFSFEMLKYCYERRINEFSIVNFTIKTGAIVIPGAIKIWPTISKLLIGA
jgi:hypothetical protein